MKKPEIARKMARQSGGTRGDAADRLDRLVQEILVGLRHGKETRLPGLGCFLPGADALFSCLAKQAGIRVFATGTYPEVLAGAVRRHPWVTTLQKPFAPSAISARLAGSARP